jgi:replicative DNA helicase
MEPNANEVAQHLKRLILHEVGQYYAEQRGDQYLPASETLTDKDLEDHLDGKRTLGIKLIQPKTLLVKAGALDLDAPSADRADLEAALGTARQVQAAAAGLGLPTAIEFSGRRGWHVWVFTQTPIPAATMRGLLTALADRAGCPGTEVFPAGDRISEDGKVGSGAKPFKLPCGLHKVSGYWAGFVGEGVVWGEDGLPVLPDQGSVLEAIEQAAPAQVLGALSSLAPPTSGAIGPEERLPDLSRLGEAEPACIAWLREHGAPLGQPYNSVNLTLARYAVSRGLREEEALLLAGAVAQATRPEHPTGKAEPQDKLRNFQSALRSVQREPARYPFNCSYVRGSQELKREACSGRNCPAWPYGTGETTAPAPRPASPADRLAEREAIAFLIANHEEALPLALQQQLPPESFLTLEGPDGEEPRHRIVWEAVLALAGQEVRPSTILAEWETVQAAPVTSEQAAWLGALTSAPTCSRSTFMDHLDRLRETGNREVLAKRLREAEEANKQRDALPAVLDNLITSALTLQRREGASILPMIDQTGEILQGLLTSPPVHIETPSEWLNSRLTGGWLPGRLYVVGAPPGEGKTTFCAWAADYAAASGTPVLFVAYEMTREQLYVYALARAGEINSGLIEGRRWTDPSFKAAGALASQIAQAAQRYDETIAPRLTILEAGPEVTPAYLKGAIGQVRARAGLEDSAPVLVVIDYLQCMNTGEEDLDSGSNETQKASRLATSLKQLARDTGAAVIAISDITKQAYVEALKSGGLTMAALRESFKISHAADTVLLLKTEDIEQPAGRDKVAPPPKTQLQLAREYARPGSKKLQALAKVEINYDLDPRLRSSYAMLSILKNRGGRQDRVLFVYDRAYHRFRPIDLAGRAWEEEEAEEDNGAST